MYKDPIKQREANRQASKKYRDSMTGKGMTVSPEIIPQSDIRVIPEVEPDKPKRGKDIKCFADLPPDIQLTIDYMSTVDGKIDQAEKAKRAKRAVQYQHLFPDKYNGTNALALTDAECESLVGSVVGKPGDADYNGICTEEWRAERGR